MPPDRDYKFHIPDVPGGPVFDEHNHTMRDMLPTDIGNSVSISQDDVVTITENYTLDLNTEVWENLEIAASSSVTMRKGFFRQRLSVFRVSMSRSLQ